MDQKARRNVRNVLKEHARDLEQLAANEKTLLEIPTTLRNLIESELTNIAKSFDSIVGSELQRCYGTDIANLSRRGKELAGNEIEIGIEDHDSGLIWKMQSSQGSLITTKWEAGGGSASGRTAGREHDTLYGFPAHFLADPDYFYDIVPMAMFDRMLAGIAPASHYLPASRTGILQGHRTLASLIVGRSSLAWIEPMEIPRLPGVVTDLIQALLLLGRPHKQTSRLTKVVEYLESNVIKGKLHVDVNRDEYPEIYYENEAGQFQLHQVSSMVSEIAPMILFLKDLIQPGDLFIIEEPESHIDASSQRNLARAIAMMVNAGVRVLITTHSDFFLNQINNSMLVAQVNRNKRWRMGYKAAEVLDADMVSAYLFRPDLGGTQVDRLEISRDYGIPTESFDLVHRELFDEATKLEHSI